MAANNWIPIQTLSGAAANYSFTSIPSGYKSLILKGSMQSATNTFMQICELQCNGDTGTSYAKSTFGYRENATTLRYFMGDAQTGGYFGWIGGSYLGDWNSHVELHIFGYDNTDRYTQWAATCSTGAGAQGYNSTIFMGGIWKNTSVVTQLDTVYLNPDAGSRLTLYGRK
tara:strand:- start:773 stop:1282 length:510 start_codon:yes stop_codon:yes gene_type:complete